MLLWPELGRGLVQLGHTLVDQSVVLSSHAGFGSSFGGIGGAKFVRTAGECRNGLFEIQVIDHRARLMPARLIGNALN